MTKRIIRHSIPALAPVFAALLWTSDASAQVKEPSPSSSSVLQTVLRDPATYVPAAIKFSAMRLDWESSQVFFQHGFVERNARFTVSGRSNDPAVSHGAGTRKIAADSLAFLGQTASENLAVRMIEHVLIQHYPEHRKAWHVVGHVGRIVGTSYLSYASSMGHLRQWRRNEQLARQLGYK